MSNKRIGINRFTEKVSDTEYKIYSFSFPQFYEDSDGNFNDIDLWSSQSMNNSKVGDFELYDKNIHSLGIRKDGNTSKYLGIRPDKTQNIGSEQVEWSIENININKNNITPDLSKYETKGLIKNLGNIVIEDNKSYVRQMVHYTSSIEDFAIKYKLNLTGLHISNSKYTKQTKVRNSISCSFIDCGNISANDYYSMTELQTHSESILSMYFSDEALFQNPNFNPNPYYNYNEKGFEMMSGSEFTIDTESNFSVVKTDEKFWESDSIKADMISSAYLKDSILLRFKNKYLGDKVRDYIFNLIDADIEDGYIRINGGKKVGWYGNPCNEEMPFMVMALKDITHISSSFRYKNFDDFSHITMSYSDITNKIKKCIDELGTFDEIESSTDYYKPNDENRYDIIDEEGNPKYTIVKPVLLTSKFEPIIDDTMHTLKDNGDGSYEYIKYPTTSLLFNGITSSVNYIDVQILETTNLYDGFLKSGVNNNWSEIHKDTGSWNVEHENTPGNPGYIGSFIYKQQSKGGKSYKIGRGAITFDLRELPHRKISNVSINVNNQGGEDSNFQVFSYESNGFEVINRDHYSASLLHNNYTDVIYTSSLVSNRNTFILNQLAINDATGSDSFNVMFRDYNYDILDDAPDWPGAATKNVYFGQWEWNDPAYMGSWTFDWGTYLYVTLENFANFQIKEGSFKVKSGLLKIK